MVRQKLGVILENKVVQKLMLEKNVFNKIWPPKLMFFDKTPMIFDNKNLNTKYKNWYLVSLLILSKFTDNYLVSILVIALDIISKLILQESETSEFFQKHFTTVCSTYFENRIGTIHLRCWQIFQDFRPLTPYYR